MDRIFTFDQVSLVEKDLDRISSDEICEVNVKDLTYVYRTLQEYMRFFHNPTHYANMGDLDAFMGTLGGSGAFTLLKDCVYNKIPKMIPDHIDQYMADGFYESNEVPFNYNENRHSK